MVKVYFEYKGCAELVAVFGTEQMYSECFQSLQHIAMELGCIITESVEDKIELSDLIK